MWASVTVPSKKESFDVRTGRLGMTSCTVDVAMPDVVLVAAGKAADSECSPSNRHDAAHAPADCFQRGPWPAAKPGCVARQ